MLPRLLIKRLLLWLAPTHRSRAIPGVPGRVHRHDVMLYDASEESVLNYLRAGASAVENIELALAEAGRTFSDIQSLLDFGCGHGRILRLLQQHVPPHRITGCDVDAEAVWFCSAEFGVKPLVSSWDLRKIRLKTYDLIWSGSVFTHLDEENCEILIGHLGRALRPGGIVIFSAHGQLSLDGLAWLYEGIYAGEADDIRQEVAERGFSFRHYGAEFGEFPGPYGMTWHSRQYLIDAFDRLFDGEIELLLHRPQGWDNHHDVFAFRRRV